MLNAFRHHGLYRGDYGHVHGQFSPTVLNAFRHHGLYREAAVQGAGLSEETCSTPFGITDYIGPPG